MAGSKVLGWTTELNAGVDAGFLSLVPIVPALLKTGEGSFQPAAVTPTLRNCHLTKHAPFSSLRLGNRIADPSYSRPRMALKLTHSFRRDGFSFCCLRPQRWLSRRKPEDSESPSSITETQPSSSPSKSRQWIRVLIWLASLHGCSSYCGSSLISPMSTGTTIRSSPSCCASHPLLVPPAAQVVNLANLTAASVPIQTSTIGGLLMASFRLL